MASKVVVSGAALSEALRAFHTHNGDCEGRSEVPRLNLNQPTQLTRSTSTVIRTSLV